MSQLAPAYAAFRAGDRATALRIALDLRDSAVAADALALAALILAEAGQAAELDRLDDAAAKIGLGRGVLFCRVLKYCLDQAAYPVLERLVNLVARDSALFPLSVYFAGCARLMRGETLESLGVFRLFRSLTNNPAQYALMANPEINVYFRQGRLVAPPDEVIEILARQPVDPPVFTEFTMIRQAPPAPALFIAAADGRYIARFAREFVAALPPDLPVHLHIVNPLPDSLPDLLVWGAARPGGFGVSTSLDRHFAHAIAYACARFYILPELLRIYATRLIALDIDIAATPAISAIRDLPPGFDFAMFRMKRNEPGSIYQCSVMVAEPNPNAAEFLRDLGAYCRPALGLRLQEGWLLDQAAIFSVLAYYKRNRPSFRFGILNDLLGLELADLATNLASDEAKHAMRYQVAAVTSS